MKIAILIIAIIALALAAIFEIDYLYTRVADKSKIMSQKKVGISFAIYVVFYGIWVIIQ